jgi:hypothetical protein
LPDDEDEDNNQDEVEFDDVRAFELTLAQLLSKICIASNVLRSYCRSLRKGKMTTTTMTITSTTKIASSPS